jgi:hypothetical protein
VIWPGQHYLKLHFPPISRFWLLHVGWKQVALGENLEPARVYHKTGNEQTGQLQTHQRQYVVRTQGLRN